MIITHGLQWKVVTFQAKKNVQKGRNRQVSGLHKALSHSLANGYVVNYSIFSAFRTVIGSILCTTLPQCLVRCLARSSQLIKTVYQCIKFYVCIKYEKNNIMEVYLKFPVIWMLPPSFLGSGGRASPSCSLTATVRPRPRTLTSGIRSLPVAFTAT